MKKYTLFILAIIFPILALLGVTFRKAYIVSYGKVVRLPIEGYDPRDILSGHYVIYNIKYGIEDLCKKEYKIERDACVCINEPESSNSFVYACTENSLKNCKVYIRGKCERNRFVAGIEKYFIPQEKANHYDREVRKGTAEIEISVDKYGKAIVKDLILPNEQ